MYISQRKLGFVRFCFASEPKEVLREKGVLKNFCKIHRKTPVPETLFNKVAGWRVQLY